MTLQKPMRLLLEHARPIILTGYRRESCIASTAIGIKVLQRFGIKAWPVPVHVVAMNAIYVDMMNETQGKEMPPEEQQLWLNKGAWSVEISSRPAIKGGFAGGHLVIGVKDHLLDLSLDQASRPHKDLPLEPLAINCPPGFYEPGDQRVWQHCGTSIVVYQHQGEYLDSLESSNNWTNEDGRHDPFVEKIETKIRAELRKRKR